MISVDDQPMPWEEGLTIAKLLARIKPDFPFYVVKVNGRQTVRRPAWRYFSWM